MKTRNEMREARRWRSRRVRALLASGLVLGIGTAATLAAWNDTEETTATFQAGTFGITGSVNGTTFTDYTTTGAPKTLTFQVTPTAMTPGTTTYALFSVKTLAGSVGGNLQLTAGTPGGTGLASHLRYGVRTIPTGAPTQCNATTYAAGAAVVPDDSALTVSGASTRAVAAAGVGQVNYCFAVTLPTGALNAAQGLTMTQTWQILGTNP